MSTYSKETIHLINPQKRPEGPYRSQSRRYVLWFGAYGATRLMVYAGHLEDALDQCVDWIAVNAPGLLANDEIQEEYARLVASGMNPEEAEEEASQDATIAGSHGDHLHSWEWGIVSAEVDRAGMKAILKDYTVTVEGVGA